MKYNFPIQTDRPLTLVQPFHVRAPVGLSQALDIQPVDHLGVDITCGTPQETWGTPCVWPFPWEGTVYDAQVDSPMGAKLHAHSQIDGVDPATGIKYSLIYLHLSSITAPTTFNQGDVIGHIGNNGAVVPAPTPEDPYAGTHLHLGMGVKNPGDTNYTMVDPMTMFDLIPFSGEEAMIKEEVDVLNRTTDPSIRQSFITLIVSQVRKYLGF